MFGLGMAEIILIAVVILIVVGPKRLPEIAKSIGKGYGEFRRSFNELKQSVNIDEATTISRQDSFKKELTESYKSQWEQKLPETTSVTKTSQKTSSKIDEKKNNNFNTSSSITSESTNVIKDNK